MTTKKQITIAELRERFLKVYARLPFTEKLQPICVLKHKATYPQPYSWNVVRNEVDAKTLISKRMLRQMERLEFI